MEPSNKDPEVLDGSPAENPTETIKPDSFPKENSNEDNLELKSDHVNQRVVNPQDMKQTTRPDISKLLEQQRTQSTAIVTFEETWRAFLKLELTDLKRQAAEDILASQTFVQKLLNTMNNVHGKLFHDKCHFLALAKVPYKEDDPLYFNILSTIYTKLTRREKAVERFGEHWETVGFQGIDPATDLRGVGTLGLIQLLALVTIYEDQAIKLFDYSKQEHINFPIGIFGLDVTQTVKELLRLGVLDKLINNEKNVIKLCNELYFAIFMKAFSIFKERKYTVDDYPRTRKEIIDQVKKDPEFVINEFKQRATMDLY
jgi:hypothetical protein